ncbi:amidohydrolase family protein [Planococcus dechangensis]|uniref:Amidohydrolase family protein n=1 Tax=Planococcus dechangensis TaxID=1176255 RepID=A0ABV9ME25_9BACL
MSSYNAAQSLGLSKKGRIAKGMDADIVMLSPQLAVDLTLCRGEIAFFKK